ncbi:MAG: hypothetical protein A3G23_05245 [Bacteroidetes bacterium RIFCSPLOWO2_12_FULL_37_12]|nr:MAG: hypothetical protein A3G23_05245 [Bacteroidetes bacterium RIFCSPLOWO2_12_FULL_37_12]
MTENDIRILMEDESIRQKVHQLKSEFIRKSASGLDVNDHDFLGLVFLTPMILMALANDEISLSEEWELNKKARMLSTGRYFFEPDPVILSMKFLIKRIGHWKKKFLELIRYCLEVHSGNGMAFSAKRGKKELTHVDLSKEVLDAPYFFVRFIAFLFFTDENEIKPRKVSTKEKNEILEIAKIIGISESPVFLKFFKELIIY